MVIPKVRRSIPKMRHYYRHGLMGVLLACCACAVGIKMTKNQMETAYRKFAISPVFYPSLNCIIDKGSKWETNYKSSTPGPLSTFTYGILQIRSHFQCGVSKPGGLCNERCSSYLDDDVTNDVKCAKKILEINGLKNWEIWQKNCKSVYRPRRGYDPTNSTVKLSMKERLFRGYPGIWDILFSNQTRDAIT